MIDIAVKSIPLNLNECIEKSHGLTIGGTVTFIGKARDHTNGRKVLRLEFEAYKAMAIKEMSKIANEAKDKWKIDHLIIHHREGTVLAGEIAVVIVAAAERRDPAFQACRYAIDELKKRVPIWKKEIFEDGAEWVTPHP